MKEKILKIITNHANNEKHLYGLFIPKSSFNLLVDKIVEATNDGELELLKDKLQKIKNWIDAYPIKIFPEPDFKKAPKVLKENGMTLDSVSASNMRHVLSGIKDIIGGKN